MSSVINLDDESKRSQVLVTEYRGMRVALTRERVHELLGREQELLALLAGGATPAPVASGGGGGGGATGDMPHFEFHARSLPNETVSHASLSTRIKKVHAYSQPTRKLRAAHIGLLQDLIANFDWVIPEHATTRLEQQLLEMMGWREVPDAFRGIVMKFLERYSRAKRAATGT